MIPSGTRLGPYTITAPIGSGGMGEVYRATDTRLGRTVAIKVLPPDLSADPELRLRFEREAKSVATLSHPHICPVFDVGSQDGINFLVMEYLEGETLEQRLTKGALPFDQALHVGIQIADALAAAHRTGIVHRDLKPGNIMMTKSGAKLLDFGLAKANAPITTGNLSMVPTTPPNLTARGTILGTFQYMAPEQLEGHEADARTDIFALGVVLYEMFTGRKAFERKSQASLISAILNDNPPPVSALVAIAPRACDRLVSACLAKEPDQRWQSARDLWQELTWIADGRPELPAGAAAPPRWNRGVIAALLLAVALGLGGVAGWMARTPAPSAVSQFEVLPPLGTIFPGANGIPRFAVSPDGESIVFQAGPPGGPFYVWERRLDSVTPRSFPFTESLDANSIQGMFWSPDGRYVGYFDQLGGKLLTIDLQSGTVQPVADVMGNQMGGSANEAGDIIYSTLATKGILRVTGPLATPASITRIDESRTELAHLWPRFLPGGRRFLYLSTAGRREDWAVYAGSLDSPERTLIVRSEFMAEFAAPNTLLYVRGDALLAQTIDLDTLELIGEPQVVQQPVAGTGAGRIGASVSQTGVLVYAGGLAGEQGGLLRRTLVWVDREGKEESLPVPTRAYTYARISPDGTRVALDIRDQENDIWVWDFGRATLTRVTFGPFLDRVPLWTPDSRRLIFTSNRSGGLSNIYWQTADGTGTAEPLTTNANVSTVSSISPDGSEVLFESNDQDLDLFAVPLQGTREIREVLRVPSGQRNGMISPDGRWLAYQSNESGRDEVYVRPYPDVVAGRWQISNSGGARPLWSRNSRELFYIAPGNRFMAVRVEAAGSWVAGTPTQLFASSAGFAFSSLGPNSPTYDVAPDGKRFLMIKLLTGGESDTVGAPITLVVTQNWRQLQN